MFERVKKAAKDTLYLHTYTSIEDNRQLTIHNFRKIIEFNDICIRLRTVNMEVRIWGSGLTVEYFGVEGLAVRGKISSVEFVEGVC